MSRRRPCFTFQAPAIHTTVCIVTPERLSAHSVVVDRGNLLTEMLIRRFLRPGRPRSELALSALNRMIPTEIPKYLCCYAFLREDDQVKSSLECIGQGWKQINLRARAAVSSRQKLQLPEPPHRLGFGLDTAVALGRRRCIVLGFLRWHSEHAACRKLSVQDRPPCRACSTAGRQIRYQGGNRQGDPAVAGQAAG